MSFVSVLGFTGAYRDSVTNCYPLGKGYRCYLPGLMRFNAPDDFSPFWAGGINPYIYCADDPVNRIDPSGHLSIFPGEAELLDDVAITVAEAHDTSADSGYLELSERNLDIAGESPKPDSKSFNESNWDKTIKNRKAKSTFQNWVWVEEGKVARASAPNYRSIESDSSQNMTLQSMRVLKAENITRIVAMNSIKLPPAQIDALNKEGIEYLWLNVRDFKAPSISQLVEGSEFIESNPGATLVYCGFGKGRTGVQISAWEIYSGRKTAEEAIRTTTTETQVQIDTLRLVPERWPFS